MCCVFKWLEHLCLLYFVVFCQDHDELIGVQMVQVPWVGAKLLALDGLIFAHHLHRSVLVPFPDSIHWVKYFGHFHVDVSVILNCTSAPMTKPTHSSHFSYVVRLTLLYLPRPTYTASLHFARLNSAERHLRRRGASICHCSDTEIALRFMKLLLLAAQWKTGSPWKSIRSWGVQQLYVLLSLPRHCRA